MTISSEVRKAGPFSGNGSVTSFPFDFKIFAASDLAVYLTDPAGKEVPLNGSDYTVQMNANQESAPGGTVKKATPLATGHLLTITSKLPYLQPVRLTNQGGFYPDVINTALDRLTIFSQQLAEQVGRAVKVKVSSAATPEQMLGDLQADAASARSAANAAAGSASTASSAAAVAQQARQESLAGASNAAAARDAAASSAASAKDSALTAANQASQAAQKAQEAHNSAAQAGVSERKAQTAVAASATQAQAAGEAAQSAKSSAQAAAASAAQAGAAAGLTPEQADARYLLKSHLTDSDPHSQYATDAELSTVSGSVSTLSGRVSALDGRVSSINSALANKADASNVVTLNSAQDVKSLKAYWTQNAPLETGAARLAYLEVVGSAQGGPAMLAFHRPSAGGIYFGLDVDGYLKIGGWSWGGFKATPLYPNTPQAPGQTPVYGARALANFIVTRAATGVLSLSGVRASSNVSSITMGSNAVTVNFSVPMIDGNYTVIALAGGLPALTVSNRATTSCTVSGITATSNIEFVVFR